MPLFGTVDWIMKNILFAASECVPFIKTGGLADVVGALPKSLDRSEYDVRVIIPNYTCIPWEYRSQFRYVSHFYMDYGRHVENVHVGIMEYVYEGGHFYFIDNEYYFKRSGLYGFYDDGERFAFFSRAILETLFYTDFEPDIINCNDWQTALTPVYLNLAWISWRIPAALAHAMPTLWSMMAAPTL